MKIKSRPISHRIVEGKIIISKKPISFLGTIDPKTGTVVEKKHPLYGKSIKESILVFPHGKGSTVGSYVIYQLSKNFVAPSGIINIECEPIIAVGAIISDIPLIDKLENNFYNILKDEDLIRINTIEDFVELCEKDK